MDIRIAFFHEVMQNMWMIVIYSKPCTLRLSLLLILSFWFFCSTDRTHLKRKLDLEFQQPEWEHFISTVILKSCCCQRDVLLLVQHLGGMQLIFKCCFLYQIQAFHWPFFFFFFKLWTGMNLRIIKFVGLRFGGK
jgi:hypothetical protein